ncbi:MAG: hypothetical protein J6N45_06325, partial [Alphaproteobacteria bacterium]|nr:hypothetical protein [Alphaproteobacteria bacterium]
MKCQFYKSKTALPLLCLGGMFLGFIFFNVAQADVCFLPMGGCVERDALSAPENCAGYSTQKKNKRGWNCATCNANGHTYYKCEEKSCGAGYTAGIESCTRGYTHEYEKDDEGKYVYSGDKKCGKCTTPDGCADGTQLSPVCEQSGFKPVETQNYKGAQVCYACLDDNCYGGKRKYCSWSSGSQSGPSGSVRAKSREWYTSTARTKYGSTCYQCCNNECSKGSQDVTSCNPNTELLRTLEHTKCGSACNECCNNVCSVGSLSSDCPSGEYTTVSGKNQCGNTCYSCVDCGGYKSKPSGCYSCESKVCGGETRWYCETLSNTCSEGSTSQICKAGLKAEDTGKKTDCGNTCYRCICNESTSFAREDSCKAKFPQFGCKKDDNQCWIKGDSLCDGVTSFTSEDSCKEAFPQFGCVEDANKCWIKGDSLCDENTSFAREDSCKAKFPQFGCVEDANKCWIKGDFLCDESTSFAREDSCKAKFPQFGCV